MILKPTTIHTNIKLETENGSMNDIKYIEKLYIFSHIFEKKLILIRIIQGKHCSRNNCFARLTE